MTNQQHLITPPPEQLRQWQIQIEYCSTRASREALVAQIFAAGADQELEACCEWLDNTDVDDSQEAAKHLRVARRPKAPSLKEQALAQCNDYIDPDGIIRRALEALPDDPA